MNEGPPAGSPGAGDPGRGAAHLWLVEVNRPPIDAGVIWSWLSQDERDKAERFHAAADRQRSVVTRGMLRGILGVALSVPPQTLAIEHDERGKPWLAGPHRGAGLSFSVSHSGEYALIGVVREHRIGVDIEQMHRAGDVMGIAERFLAPEEARAIQARDTAAALELFFRIWTRKEACAKGVGDGLGLDFAGFTAGWEGNAGTCLILNETTATSTRWNVSSLATVPAYAAAVAIDSADVELHLNRLGALEVPT